MIRPLADRIVVKPDEYLPASDVIVVKVRQGQIIESQKQFGRLGTVLAVGPGKRDKKGNVKPLTLKPGDRVCFGEFLYQGEGNDIVMQEADVTYVIDEDRPEAGPQHSQSGCIGLDNLVA